MRRSKEIPLKKLQIQHIDATRKLILEWAMHLLVAERETPFSHESVADAAGISARTVYRHFPSRDELITALWHEFQREHQASLPKTEEELLQKTAELYRNFDRYEGLVRAYLSSPASQAPIKPAAVDRASLSASQRDSADATGLMKPTSDAADELSAEMKRSLEQSLARLTGGMDDEHRSQVFAAFLALCSPQAWQVMRDQGGLSGAQAAKAAQLAMAALMEALRPRASRDAGAPVLRETEPPPKQSVAQARLQTARPPESEAGQSAAKWKGVYDNPVIATLKKLIPKE
jgi:AcrR family transcriptional regulator